MSESSQAGLRRVPGRVFIVRHVATEWSTAGRHTGRTDVALLPEAEEEARALGPRLAAAQPALVLSSPLRRALDTCVLAGFGDRVETTDLLCEMDYGDYEGLTTAEVRARRPAWDLFLDGCPNGETIEDVGRRADLLIERFRNDASLVGRDVVVFAHGHVLRVFTARWLGLQAADARRFVLGTGKVGVLAWEHEWTVLTSWNR